MTGRQRVTFGSAAGVPLAGWLDLPDGEPTAVALFAHCFTCGEDGHAPARIARGLTDRGIAVLRFDFTGPGESAGESAAATFSSSIEDPVAGADFLRKGWGGPQLMVGHSVGGAAVLAAAERVPEVTAVVTIGAPATLRTSRTCWPAWRRRSGPVGRPTC